jgi:ribosomal protein S18 acetylase RimI-like enzyme
MNATSSHRPVIAYEATDDPPDAALATVDEGLERHNVAAAPLNDVKRLAALARDAEGRVVGGAVGRTWGRCCELLQLWVESECRGQGVGSHLLDVFEAHARTRGCSIFYLTTLSYQAPQFYRARGYSVMAEIDGYPDGIVKYLMHKQDV